MAIVVTPTHTNPTHHIKLTDGVNEVGFILRSGSRIDPRAISRRPRQNGQYSPFTQSDWGSGRGIKDAQSDRSRFADSKRAITRHSGTVMIGGQETYTTGFRDLEQYMPGKLTWTPLITSNRYLAYKFTASASTNRSAIYFWVRRRGTPGTLTVELCADSGGDPDTVLKTVTKTTSNITDTVSELVEFAFSSVQAVTASTAYWVKIYGAVTDTASNYWEVGTDAARTNALTKRFTAGVGWSNAAVDLYFRIVDDTDLLGGLFFNYKSQLYFVTRPSGTNAPKLYINGDRGVATGSQTTTTLKDTTKSWTTNAFAGATLLIVEGTNSEWQTPYRTIVSNTSDTLTFSPAFPRAGIAAGNNNATIYIILGSNVWTEIADHGLTALPTSVAVAGDVCYFAMGDIYLMRKMREYLSGSTWTREFAREDNYAKFLVSYSHPTKGMVLAKANDRDNSGRPSVAIATAEPWGQSLKYPYHFDSVTNSSANWTAGTGVTLSLDNTDYLQGNGSIKMVVASGPPNPIAYVTPGVVVYSRLGRVTYGINLAGQYTVRFWFKSSVALAAGGATIYMSKNNDASTTIEDLSLPALPANTWTQVTLSYNNKAADLSNVLTLGIRATATGTYWIDGFEVVPQGVEIPLGSPNEKITGMEVYGDPAVPWVFRTQSAGSIENGVFNPIPLRELSTAESVYNGMGHTVHNVNLYFSFLHGLERFYRNNLDDVGPNRDEGLPDDRRGYITSMQGYIGRFLYNYDVQAGYSAIMESTSGSDHHEMYRSDTAGKRIRNIYIQVIPGDTADRLWFTEGEDIAWLPLPGNTLKEDTDSTFLHTHEAYLETGWLYGSEQDAVKLYHSVKLFTENLTSSRKIEWDYRTDDNSTWTAVSTAFTSSPVQEVTLNVSCKRIKFRFRLQTNDNTETPVMKAMFVSGTTRPETRWTYTLSTYAEDSPIDLQGNEDTSLSASAVLAQLDSWMEANTILTMRSVFDPFDNKSVMLEPVVVQPLSIITDESKERVTLTVNLLEP